MASKETFHFVQARVGWYICVAGARQFPIRPIVECSEWLICWDITSVNNSNYSSYERFEFVPKWID